jgi:rRNA maturation protein Nop10
MLMIQCNVCGGEVTVVSPMELSDPDTDPGETPADHLARTGHSPRQPETRYCKDCENVWPYSGDIESPTCPACRGKHTAAVHPTDFADSDDDEGGEP